MAYILGNVFSGVAVLMMIAGVCLTCVGCSVAMDKDTATSGLAMHYAGIALIVLGGLGGIVCSIFAIMGASKTKKHSNN